MEQNFVNWILNNLPHSPNSLIGNGDDCAILTCENMPILVATDMLLDGTHFLSYELAPELIGRKAVAVNLSDLAAMGGGTHRRVHISGHPKDG